jgi:hypothetical protein
MKFVARKDGIERTTILVEIALDRDEVAEIKAYLKQNGESYSDASVKRFVRTCTEYFPPSNLRDDVDDDDFGSRTYL